MYAFASNITSVLRSSTTGSDIPIFFPDLHELFPPPFCDSKQRLEVVIEVKKIKQLTGRIRWILQNMDDGEISVSPYDTAWVALVEDIHGNGRPQFSMSLEWISNNQLVDGSWGDHKFFLYDRILNTLACVVALTTWKMHPQKCHKGSRAEALPAHPHYWPYHKGLRFLRENVEKLENEDEEMMPIAFEVAFPSLVQIAKKLGIEIQDESPYMKNITAKRDLKLRNIPIDLLHKKPTSLLHSLEGMEGLVWEKLLNFCFEGSFLCSPSSTAYALHHTKDQACLQYLLKSVQKFDGGDAFKQFEKGGEFCCFQGQSTNAITGMYNLYRASQTMFNGENILGDARNYTAKFLHQKRVDNAIVDKWIITKDLPGEVGYALDVPFYASLPRLEARFFIEQYGGDDDVWIGKTLYRMPYVNCDTYLEMAKLDYKNCQVVHQLEWKSIQKWYGDCNLAEFGLSERRLLLAYYIAASSAFEPEKSRERLAWAKTSVLVHETIASLQLCDEEKCEFANEFECSNMLKYENEKRYETRLVEIIINTVSQISSEILVTQGRDIHQHLSNEWKKWLKTWEEGGDLGKAEARLLLRTLHLCSGLDDSTFSHPKYNELMKATSKVCHKLRLFQNRKVREEDAQGCITLNSLVIGTTFQIEASMQELVKLVFTKCSEDLDSQTKQSFFAIARSFYYTAYCDAAAINSHIHKVLFEKLD
ncbi:hypothetical protein C2S52_021131 [Perilla frutescens var. hirtella]|nr:hypothetical protein C2S52_021131 [Perilla frutescens var. hirtella]